MMKKDVLKFLLRDFHTLSLPDLTTRDISVPLGTGKIVTLIGSRRSGKTWLLYQLASELYRDGVPKENVCFLNFEDERLDLEAQELDLLLQAYQELYPGIDLAQCYFLFDEIQNIPGWERFVRRIHERICPNIVVTGSNARLLSTEIATALRGRAITRTVYPFSFREVLKYRNIPLDLHASSNRTKIEATLDAYLEQGGFPETLAMRDRYLREETLQSYFEVMLLRDLVDRYRFTNITALRYFLKRLAASATKQISVHGVYSELKSAGIRIGKNALYDFLQGAEDIFFAKTLPRYSSKVMTRELGEKKIFIIDNGLLNAIRFRFSEDRGKAMEQVVYWQLMRNKKKGSSISFFKNGYECDFIMNGEEMPAAMQVCYSLEDPKIRQREIKGLVQTCRSLGIHEGQIITRNDNDRISLDGVLIRVLPLAEYLLQLS